MSNISRNERRRIETAVAARTASLTQSLKAEQFKSQNLKSELDQAAKRDSDRLATISAREQVIASKEVKIADLVAERDRLIRMVDQFTSISIIPHGARVEPGAANLPATLRKT